MRKHLATAVAAVSLAMAGQAVYADINAAKKWIDSEFQPSVLKLLSSASCFLGLNYCWRKH